MMALVRQYKQLIGSYCNKTTGVCRTCHQQVKVPYNFPPCICGRELIFLILPLSISFITLYLSNILILLIHCQQWNVCIHNEGMSTMSALIIYKQYITRVKGIIFLHRTELVWQSSYFLHKWVYLYKIHTTFSQDSYIVIGFNWENQ